MSPRPAIPALLFAAFLAGVAVFPGISHADILRWVDDDGVIHFTDDPSTIPARHRGKEKVIINERKTPGQGAAELSAPPPPIPAPPSQDAPPPDAAAEPFAGAEDPAATADNLRAKIAAKESFVRQVEEKRSLSTNPLRNRVVSPADIDLFNKYQMELPDDRARLEALEKELGQLK